MANKSQSNPKISKGRTKADLPAKICVACGRPMIWRKRWERVWDEVKFCSERCRRENKAKKAAD